MHRADETAATAELLLLLPLSLLYVVMPSNFVFQARKGLKNEPEIRQTRLSIF